MMFYSSLVQNIRYTHYHAIQLIGLGYIVSVFSPIIVQAWGAPLGQNINCCFVFLMPRKLSLHSEVMICGCGGAPCAALFLNVTQPLLLSVKRGVSVRWERFFNRVQLCFLVALVVLGINVILYVVLSGIYFSGPASHQHSGLIYFIYLAVFQLNFKNKCATLLDNLSSRASRVNNGRKYLVCRILHQCSAVHCFVMYL